MGVVCRMSTVSTKKSHPFTAAFGVVMVIFAIGSSDRKEKLKKSDALDAGGIARASTAPRRTFDGEKKVSV